MKTQLEIRKRYASRRRRGFFKKTSRVVWKSKSKVVA